MSVVAAVERELERLPRDLADSALAASALVMARELDSSGNSATSKSMCQARLQDVMDRLYELRPPSEELDQLDELSAKRRRRIGGGSNPKA